MVEVLREIVSILMESEMMEILLVLVKGDYSFVIRVVVVCLDKVVEYGFI